MDGWAEANASRLLENLNIPTEKHELLLKDLTDNEKIGCCSQKPVQESGRIAPR